MYEQVQLYTRHGILVTTVSVRMNDLVGTTVGTMYPDVVQWGARIFVLQGGRYVEGTYYAVQA